MSEVYICPKCREEIDGPRYSSRWGMLCEDCNEEAWKEIDKEIHREND
jgi:hypothetical protein